MQIMSDVSLGIQVLLADYNKCSQVHGSSFSVILVAIQTFLDMTAVMHLTSKSLC